MPSRNQVRTWLQRGLLALLVGSVLVFGLRASGSVANRVATVDGSVWLADPTSGVMVHVNALAKDVTAKVPVAAPFQQLDTAQVGSGAIVLNRSTSAVGRVDGVTLEYQARKELASPGSDLALVGNDAGAFAVDTSDGRLIALDTTTLSTRYEATISAQQATPAVVDGRGRLWAYDARKGELVRFDAQTGQVVRQAVAEPGRTAGLTLAGDRPVLVDPASGAFVRLRDDGSVGQRICAGERNFQGRLAVAGSPPGAAEALVFALDTDSGELWTADLQRQSCVNLPLSEDRDDAGDSFGDAVVSEGKLFVPVFTRSQVLVVDGAANRLERAIDLRFAVPAGNRFELFLDGGRLWFNDLEGPKAGVLSAAGATLVVDKKELSFLSGGDLAGDAAAGAKGVRVVLDPDELGGAAIGNGKQGRARAGADGRAAEGVGGSGRGAGTGRGSGGGRGELGPDEAGPILDASGALPTVRTIPVPGPTAVGAGPDQKAPPPPAAPPAATDELVANFTYSPPGDPTTETSMTFVDTSTGRIDRWLWTFTAPDGQVGTVEGRTVTRTLPSLGQWTVTLTVSNSSGRTDTTRAVALQVRDVNDVLPPRANFSWDPATPAVREPVQFRDRSTSSRNGPITSWFWEFGDGSTSSAANPPAKAYAAPGAYLVRLTVRNSAGAHSTEATLRVAEPPAPLRPDFTWTVDGVPGGPIAAGQAVVFNDLTSGGPTSWAWDFGGGSVGSGPSVVHVFRAAGDVTVRLSVANATGSQTFSRTLRIDEPTLPPQAKISEPAIGVKVEVHKPLRFVSATTGSRSTQVWNWGDGTADTEGTSVLHVFDTVGTFVVKLTATNAAGSTADSIAVVVTPEPPPPPLLPSFRPSVGTSSNNPAVVGEPVRFANTSTGTGTFSWSFGDGSTSAERDPSYTFRRTGTFLVTLTMTSGTRTATATAEVFVGPPPVPLGAAFDFTPTNPTVGQPVQFVDRSTGNPTRWTWNFGDGSAVVRLETPAAKAFAAAGRFDVTLTVADRNGTVSSVTKSVVVQAAPRPAPAAAFAVTPVRPEDLVTGKAIVFTDTTPAPFPLTTPEFSFDATPVSPPAGSRSVEHVFGVEGTYPVRMRVCWVDDPRNCATVSQDVVIRPAVAKPVADFTVSGSGLLAGSNPPVLLANQPVTFTDVSTGGVTTWDWTVRVDKYATRTVTVTPSSAGTLTVTLTVSNAAGSATITRDLLVLAAAPSAAFTVSPGSVPVGGTVTFTDSAPVQATRVWDFGDGSPRVTTTAATVTHTFAAAQSAVVVLTVTVNGYSVSETRTVVVTPPAPEPVIQAANVTRGTTSTAATITVTVGDVVNFSDIGTVGLPVSESWTWSDGAVGGSGATVQRTFARAETLTLTLAATNAAGTTTVTITVVVLPAPGP